jgi:membrane protease YdiL (CAAX protease family)
MGTPQERTPLKSREEDNTLEGRSQVGSDLLVVFTIIFATDVLLAYYAQLYFPTIILWALLPLMVELGVRRGSIRNLGFQRTNFRRSVPRYLGLVAAWVLPILVVIQIARGSIALSLEYSAYVASVFFHPAFVEEVNFRGFLQTRLERLFSLRKAIVIQAAVFALYHVPAVLPTSSGYLLSIGGLWYPVLTFPFGLALGIIYAKTRNLFFTMAIHGSLLAAFLFL